MKNHAKTTYKKKSAGFTLIELIVTVSIAAILMSIAVPSFKTMIDSNRLSTGTNELVSAFILARSEALKRSQNVRVCSSADSSTCSTTDANFGNGWVVFVDCDGDGAVGTGIDCDGDATTPVVDEIIKAHSALSSLYITNNKTSGNNFLEYSFSGRPSGTVSFDVKKIEGEDSSGDPILSSVLKKIVISRSGRIRTE